MAASEYTESEKKIVQPYKIRNSAQVQAGRFIYNTAASAYFISSATKLATPNFRLCLCPDSGSHKC
jgi:hypothetical protein